jgi:hypothetical protein
MCKHCFLILGLCLLLWMSSERRLSGSAEKKNKQPPAPGTVFLFTPATPKYATCDVEFRDPGDNLWPNFFYGKPAADGAFTFDPVKPKGTFTLVCDTMVQRNGEQGRRVLGDLVKGGKPPVVTLTVQSFAAVRTEMVEAGKGPKKIDYYPAEVVLEMAGKKVAAPARVASKFVYGKAGETPESISFEIQFTVKPQDLGLQIGPGVIECRAGATGFINLDAEKKK